MKKDGGPAFPHDNQELGDRHRFAQPGMSLRDWFAGQIACGLSSHQWAPEGQPLETADQLLAEISYQVADALIAQREKE